MIGAKKTIVTMLAAALMVAQCVGSSALAAASEVKVVVNGTAITSGDVAKRVAFLRLQHQKPDVKTAQEQLVDETLKRQEIARIKLSVSKEDVDAAFGRFAAGNKLTPQQMAQILDRAGVGADHFKNFIAVQMSWPRLVNARFGASGKLSNADLVSRMMENNKQKPVVTEYILQQLIFVVPPAKKNAITAKRKSEADAARARYPGCDQGKVFAASMRDVSVRDLGRMLAPEIPEDWRPLVEQVKGNTTTTRVTDKGVEFLAICSQRQVNDDQAAAMAFREEDLNKEKAGKAAPPENENSKKYLDELRKKAEIIYQ